MTNWKRRPWSPEDLDSLVKYANNYNIARYLMNRFPHPYSGEAGKNFINMAMSDTPARIFALEVNGEAAGGIGVHPQADINEKTAEIGYWLAEPHWGKGIVTGALKEMITYSFDTFDIVRLYARPFSNNPASERVLEKAGFQFEARLKKSIFKFGEYYDELIYSIVR
jgi:RimJ/RimL family protein N-acetyltransferase